MIYLIGGAPRSGKTRLTHAVLQKRPMHCISTDAIRHMLRGVLPKDEMYKALFNVPSDDPAHRSPEDVLQIQNQESEALWPALLVLIESYNQDGVDLLIEGVAVLPHTLSSLTFDYKAIILSNQSEQHDVTVMRHAQENSHDWLHKYSQEDKIGYCKFFAHMNTWIAGQAQQYNLPLAEVHDQSFDTDLEAAAALLLTNT